MNKPIVKYSSMTVRGPPKQKQPEVFIHKEEGSIPSAPPESPENGDTHLMPPPPAIARTPERTNSPQVPAFHPTKVPRLVKKQSEEQTRVASAPKSPTLEKTNAVENVDLRNAGAKGISGLTKRLSQKFNTNPQKSQKGNPVAISEPKLDSSTDQEDSSSSTDFGSSTEFENLEEPDPFEDVLTR